MVSRSENARGSSLRRFCYRSSVIYHRYTKDRLKSIVERFASFFMVAEVLKIAESAPEAHRIHYSYYIDARRFI